MTQRYGGPVIDPHHHLWDLSLQRHPWLAKARATGGVHHPVSADILPGQRVVLDGPSGIGKSRLMAALTRDATLAEGAALLSGADVAGLRPAALTERIAHLAQRPAILRGTLAENLRLAAPDAGDAAL